MKADARFVENVERADKQRAEIRRELNSLGLAAGKRRREAAQRQIIETDIDEEFQTATNLEQQLVGDLLALFAQFEILKKSVRVADRHLDDLGQRLRTDLYVACLLPQTCSVAIRTSRVAAIFCEKDADVQLVFLRFEPLEKSLDAAPAFVAVDDAFC